MGQYRIDNETTQRAEPKSCKKGFESGAETCTYAVKQYKWCNTCDSKMTLEREEDYATQ